MNSIEKNIGYTFKDNSILSDALTHSSIKNHGNKFEQMEFLGDRILNLIVANIIVHKFKSLKAGELSNILSHLISYKTCYLVAQEIQVSQYVKTATHSLKSNHSVLADTVEALIAAVFIDSDYNETRIIVEKLWGKHINSIDTDVVNPKNKLQEITQSTNNSLPQYKTISITGPSHAQQFSVQVTALGCNAIGSGTSKKEAEISAASQMIKILT